MDKHYVIVGSSVVSVSAIIAILVLIACYFLFFLIMGKLEKDEDKQALKDKRTQRKLQEFQDKRAFLKNCYSNWESNMSAFQNSNNEDNLASIYRLKADNEQIKNARKQLFKMIK